MLHRHVLFAQSLRTRHVRPGRIAWWMRTGAQQNSIRRRSSRAVQNTSDKSETVDNSLDPDSIESTKIKRSTGISGAATSDTGSVRTSNGTGKPLVPPRLISHASDQHNDLNSFLAYADRAGLKETTNVYKGTHYEYTISDALSRLNFTLFRTGRSNDLGIDLIGFWTIPVDLSSKTRSKHVYQDLRVLVQCKATKPQPSMVRELEGAYVGAPAGWSEEDNVLALLVTREAATKGVREAVQRSRWPICVLQVTREGEVQQFLWNHVAARAGLEGLGVVVRHVGNAGSDGEDESDDAEDVFGGLTLTWMGKVWRTTDGVKSGEAAQ